MGRRRRKRFVAKPADRKGTTTNLDGVKGPCASVGRRNKRPGSTSTLRPTEGEKRRKLEPSENENPLDDVVEGNTEGLDDTSAVDSRPEDQTELEHGLDEATSNGGRTSSHVHGDSALDTSILVSCGRNEGRLYLSKLRVVVNERCRSKCIRTGNTWWTPNEFQFVSGRGAAKDWKRTVKHAGQCLKVLLTNGTLCLTSTPPKCLCKSCAKPGSGKEKTHRETVEEKDESENDSKNPDPSDGKPDYKVSESSNLADARQKGFKRRRRYKRQNIKGAATSNLGNKKGAILPTRKRRKLQEDRGQPEENSDSTVSLGADCVAGTTKVTEDKESAAKKAPKDQRDQTETATVLKRRPGRPKKVMIPKSVVDSSKVGEETYKTRTSEHESNWSVDENACAQKTGDVCEKSSPFSISSAFSSAQNSDSAAASVQGEHLNEKAMTRTDAGADCIPEKHSNRNNHPSNNSTVTATAAAGEIASERAAQPSVNDDRGKDALESEPLRMTADMESRTQLTAACIPKSEFGFRAEPEVRSAGPSFEGDETVGGFGGSGIKLADDDVTVGEDNKSDVMKRLPVSDDVSATAEATSIAAGPRKSAYLNAVIAELKRKKISRKTGVNAAVEKSELPPPTTSESPSITTTTGSPIKRETISESQRSDSKPTTDEWSRGCHAVAVCSFPSASPTGKTFVPHRATPPPPLPLPSDSKHSSFKSLTRPESRIKDDTAATPQMDSKSTGGSSSFRKSATDSTAYGKLPPPSFPHGDSAFWRHLPPMVGYEGKTGAAGSSIEGKQTATGGRGESKASPGINSPLTMSQLASIYGLSQPQLASLPFHSPQFSLFPPYLFMGFPLQPLLPQYPSVTSSLTSSSTASGHPSSASAHSPLRPAHPPSSTPRPSSPAQSQQRKRRPHHHCKNSSSKVPPYHQHPTTPSDPFTTLRRAGVDVPASITQADLNRWRSSVPGLSGHPWMNPGAQPNKSSGTGSNKFHFTEPNLLSAERNAIWRPAISSNTSAFDAANFYNAHAPTKTNVVTCRSYGDASLSTHTYKSESATPVDFTKSFRGRDKEEKRYGSATGNEDYLCDEEGVLDLSKK